MARNQFVVPQFLDVEPKIIGPITARQFLIMLAVLLLEFVIWRLFLNIFIVLALGIPVLVIGGVFAFAKINGQPFHFIALNVMQTLRRPARRIWDKTLTDTDLRVLMKKDETAPVMARNRKAPLEASRLSELTLVVNTGGVYQGDEEKYGHE
jgi:hypothetical protein